MNKILKQFKPFADLTIEQAQQVQKQYPANTDPYQYEYEIDPQTGHIIDRYKIIQQPTR